MAGNKSITNPLGAFPASGQTVAQATDIGYTSRELKASTTVTALNVVAISTDSNYTVATAATNGTPGLVIGIALESGVAGNLVEVATEGLVKAVPVNGTVTGGDVLKRSVTTAGSLATTASPATGEKIAVAIAASASNVVDVIICK